MRIECCNQAAAAGAGCILGVDAIERKRKLIGQWAMSEQSRLLASAPSPQLGNLNTHRGACSLVILLK